MSLGSVLMSKASAPGSAERMGRTASSEPAGALSLDSPNSGHVRSQCEVIVEAGDTL